MYMYMYMKTTRFVYNIIPSGWYVEVVELITGAIVRNQKDSKINVNQ